MEDSAHHVMIISCCCITYRYKQYASCNCPSVSHTPRLHRACGVGIAWTDVGLSIVDIKLGLQSQH